MTRIPGSLPLAVAGRTKKRRRRRATAGWLRQPAALTEKAAATQTIELRVCDCAGFFRQRGPLRGPVARLTSACSAVSAVNPSSLRRDAVADEHVVDEV